MTHCPHIEPSSSSSATSSSSRSICFLSYVVNSHILWIVHKMKMQLRNTKNRHKIIKKRRRGEIVNTKAGYGPSGTTTSGKFHRFSHSCSRVYPLPPPPPQLFQRPSQFMWPFNPSCSNIADTSPIEPLAHRNLILKEIMAKGTTNHGAFCD